MYLIRFAPLGGPSPARLGGALAMPGCRGRGFLPTMHTSFGHWSMGVSRGWLGRVWPRPDGGHAGAPTFACFLEAPQCPYSACAPVPWVSLGG